MIFVAVDPDVDENGLAIWDKRIHSFIHIGKNRLFDVLERIRALVDDGEDVIVFIEAGWLIKKSNFHGRKGQSKAVGEKIAKAVGANHQVGKVIQEYCYVHYISYNLIKPQGKKNAAEFKRITGWQGRTNSEMRDAAMLVFGR